MSSKEKLGAVVALWPTMMKLRMALKMSQEIQAFFGLQRIYICSIKNPELVDRVVAKEAMRN